MIELNESEAAVYELLKLKHTLRQISKTLGKSTAYINNILLFLIRNGLATKHGKPPDVIFQAIPARYTVIKRPKGKNTVQPKPDKLQILKKLIRLLGKENLRFILNHHNIVDRRKIAAKVGIRKVDLNQIYILLGIKGDDAA